MPVLRHCARNESTLLNLSSFDVRQETFNVSCQHHRAEERHAGELPDRIAILSSLNTEEIPITSPFFSYPLSFVSKEFLLVRGLKIVFQDSFIGCS